MVLCQILSSKKYATILANQVMAIEFDDKYKLPEEVIAIGMKAVDDLIAGRVHPFKGLVSTCLNQITTKIA